MSDLLDTGQAEGKNGGDHGAQCEQIPKRVVSNDEAVEIGRRPDGRANGETERPVRDHELVAVDQKSQQHGQPAKEKEARPNTFEVA